MLDFSLNALFGNLVQLEGRDVMDNEIVSNTMRLSLTASKCGLTLMRVDAR